MAVFAEDAFRVKLHAFDRQVAMSDAHDLAIIGMGGDFQHLGQTRWCYRQRVLTIVRKLPGQIAENTLLRGSDDASFAMHQRLRAHNLRPKCLADRLVP